MSTQRLRAITVLLILIVTASVTGMRPVCAASAHDYSVTVYREGQGLLQPTISSFWQSKLGYLWIATWHGVVRYDGRDFKTFTVAENPGLCGDVVRKVVEDADGVIWITAGDGISYFDGNGFHEVTPTATRMGDQISDLRVCQDGSVYCITSRRVYRCRGRKLDLVVDEPKGLTSFDATSTGTLSWICGGSVYLKRGDTVVRVRTPKSFDPSHIVTFGKEILVGGTRVGRIVADSVVLFKGEVGRLGSAAEMRIDKDGTLILNRASRMITCRVSQHPIILSSISAPRSAQGVHISVDQYGNGWGTVNLHNRVSVWRCISGRFVEEISDQQIRNYWGGWVMADRENVVWIGSGDGLFCFRQVQSRMYPATLDMGWPTAVFVDSNSTVWIGTQSKGLFYINGDVLRPCPWPLLRHGRICAIGENNEGLWISCCGEASIVHVYVAHKATLKERTSSFLSQYNYYAAFCPQSHGLAWVHDGTIHIDGVGELTPAVLGRKIDPNTVLTAFADTKHDIWAAADQLLHVRDGHVRWYRPRDGIPTTSPILGIVASEDGSAWLATWGNGLIYADPAGALTTLTTRDGLLDDCLEGITRDNTGKLWFTSSRGLFSMDEKSLLNYIHHVANKPVSTSVGAADGADLGPGVGGSWPVALTAADGTLWFVGNRGVVRVAPSRAEVIRAPVLVEDVAINGVEYRGDRPAVVPPGTGRALFHFACLSFSSPQRTMFQYRLVGEDEAFSTPSVDNTAQYTNLLPGTYALIVRARSQVSGKLIGEATYHFTIKPHFYDTIGFRILLLLVLVISPLTALGLRSKALQKRNAELELRVAERTTELREQNKLLNAMHFELETQNQELQSIQAEVEAQNDELTRTRDLLELKNQELAALATTDALTGVPNRRSLQDRLADEWRRAARYQTALSVILIDVDRFKQYNDTYGHQAGDVVLKQVASVLAGNIKDTDFVGRYGGEEFAVVLPQTDDQGAMLAAERLRAAIENHDWPERQVTISLGVATVTLIDVNVENALNRADKALYQSKEQGRNRVTLAVEDKETVSL